jgi:hypothetical protein
VWQIIVFIFLTLLTQVGGLVYLLAFLTHKIIHKNFKNRIIAAFLKLFSFALLYVITTFAIVPPAARLLGRVQLPLSETHHLKPLTFLTCLLNRNYVRPQLKDAAFKIAEEMNNAYPGTPVNYLDANFPFINKFPLIPHWSHNDGKKLDLAFCYLDVKTGKASNESPSVIGYGVCEEPRPGEVNTADLCAEKGYWQYSFLRKIVPQNRKEDFIFDSIRTAKLVQCFAAEESIGKIFIEPHLKARLKLTTDKIRFHGCHAVRHDDHLHVQLY